MTKSENGWDIEKQVDILLKQDDSKQIAYGVVYEPLVKDAHDDYMTADEIETACLSEWKPQVDLQHDFTSDVGKVIESFIALADFELGGQLVTKGKWGMAIKVVDDVWTGIQKGEVHRLLTRWHG